MLTLARLVRDNRTAFGLGALNLLLFLSASPHYPGSLQLYGLFTLCAAFMLWFGLTQNLGFGQRVLGIFLWLGIFFKLAVHLIFQYPCVEPIGGFTSSPQQYNEVLIVGIVAYAGVYAAWRLAQRHINPKKTDPLLLPKAPNASKRAPGTAALLAAFITLVVIINAMNLRFGICRAGLAARTIFFWPTNAVINWLLEMGLSLCAAVVVLRACLSRKMISWCLGAVIFEGILSGATTLGRGLYLWHVFPVFWAVWMNRERLGAALPLRRLILISVVAAAGFVATGGAVNIARNYAYSNETTAPSLSRGASAAALENAVAQLSQLAVDRWIGLEGIMVAVGYPEKSLELFKQLLAEKSAIGHISRYQFIANAIAYTHMNAYKFQFGTLPGPAGFFYLSGSRLLVFAGMFLLVLLGAVLEYGVFAATRNPFLYAVIAVWIANTIAQMGVVPFNLTKQLFMIFVAVAFISFIQSRWWGIGCEYNEISREI